VSGPPDFRHHVDRSPPSARHADDLLGGALPVLGRAPGDPMARRPARV
jgi:hypothetical protein